LPLEPKQLGYIQPLFTFKNLGLTLKRKYLTTTIEEFVQVIKSTDYYVCHFAQVYGFSWVVLAVLIILFKVQN
jgi:hypothetical protein